MMNFFWGLLLGYIVGVLYMAHRSNTDTRTNIE
jgi:hypothetical protein